MRVLLHRKTFTEVTSPLGSRAFALGFESPCPHHIGARGITLALFCVLGTIPIFVAYLILQGFVIEHTVAEPLEERICNLILNLLAHTFGRLCALPAAGTVSTGALEPFSDSIDNLLIGIELDFHVHHLFLDCGFIIPQDKSFLCDEVTLIKNPVLFEHRILRR